MPSPKNPLDGGGSIQGAPNQTIKPMQPPCDSGQFAVNPYDADNYFDVSYDQYWNERSEDRPMHGNATPQHSNPLYTGRQYSDDFNGGYSGYGVSVKPPEASTGGVMVKGDDAARGKDS